jgi:prophage regulatory protein
MQDTVKAFTEILRRPQVQERTGLSRSSIYEKMSRGEFPRPISLGAKSVGWLAQEVEFWIEQRIKASRPGNIQIPIRL